VTFERVEIAPAPWKVLMLAILSVGFVAAGVWLVKSQPSGAFLQFIGWVSILFFGACSLLWVVQSIRFRGAIVIIDSDEILDRRVSDRTIPWTAVQEVNVWSLEAQRIPILKLDPAFDASFPTKMITRWTRGANRKLGADGIAINPAGLKITFDGLLQAIVDAKTASDLRHGQR
jgi:hypothetical protein